MGDMTTVSVIATVYNEGESLHRLLDSLAAQTRPPDEVVICDGGSCDNTVAILESYRDRLPNLRVIVETGANISRGRNVAIAAARGPIIAATDAGVRLSPQWLAELVAPFEEDRFGRVKAVAGFFVPDVAGIFQTAMAATTLPLAEEIDERSFLPSSRSVAFTKDTWQRAGGYPEWLDYCEDLIFDFRINAQCADCPTVFVWRSEARVHFRPRTSLRSFWIQYYRYARGDGKADLWRKRHLIRYITYFVVLPSLIGHTVWGFFARPLGWLGLLAGMVAYCLRPWRRLGRPGADLSPAAWIGAAALVPLIRLVGDGAKMAGYPLGLWWRWKNRHRAEIHWRGKNE
jgi:glycosyltransferase involved in cell wall biosynthesis